MSGRVIKLTDNFCRVFEMPDRLSEEPCFESSIPHEFNMVDWFYPVDTLFDEVKTSGELRAYVNLERMEDKLRDFIVHKIYYRPEKSYLVITDFDFAFVIRAKK